LTIGGDGCIFKYHKRNGAILRLALVVRRRKMKRIIENFRCLGLGWLSAAVFSCALVLVPVGCGDSLSAHTTDGASPDIAGGKNSDTVADYGIEVTARSDAGYNAIYDATIIIDSAKSDVAPDIQNNRADTILADSGRDAVVVVDLGVDSGIDLADANISLKNDTALASAIDAQDIAAKDAGGETAKPIDMGYDFGSTIDLVAYDALTVADLGVSDLAADKGPAIVGSGVPSISITSVPILGQAGYARGSVNGVVPSEQAVVIYILVGSGWWIKPYSWMPLTPITADGTWSANIVTGGTDQSATKIVAYLVPVGYGVPILYGDSALPISLAGFPSTSVSR
jgi:hypothetical protein